MIKNIFLLFNAVAIVKNCCSSFYVYVKYYKADKIYSCRNFNIYIYF